MDVFPMLFKRQKVDWLFVPLLAIGLFTYASYQPRFRCARICRRSSWMCPVGSPQRQTTEAQIAQAYWNSLVMTFSRNTATVIVCPPIRLLTSVWRVQM